MKGQVIILIVICYIIGIATPVFATQSGIFSDTNPETVIPLVAFFVILGSVIVAVDETHIFTQKVNDQATLSRGTTQETPVNRA